MRRLRDEESAVGLGFVRHGVLPGVQRRSQIPRSAHLVRPVDRHGFLDAPAAQGHVVRGQRQVRPVPGGQGRRVGDGHQAQVRERRRPAVQGRPQGPGRGKAGTDGAGQEAPEEQRGLRLVSVAVAVVGRQLHAWRYGRRRRRRCWQGRRRSQRHGTADGRDRRAVRGPPDPPSRRSQGPDGGQIRWRRRRRRRQPPRLLGRQQRRRRRRHRHRRLPPRWRRRRGL
mmetsp:Transcript_28701/g.83160  ORF Transcript_28701/g.83160 Transcript_28701/m.83160 type:complete len:226 (+) Transcript_28701:139-816(+)